MKDIRISDQTHHKLSVLKISKNLKTHDEVINWLIDYYKGRVKS